MELKGEKGRGKKRKSKGRKEGKKGRGEELGRGKERISRKFYFKTILRRFFLHCCSDTGVKVTVVNRTTPLLISGYLKLLEITLNNVK